MEALNSFDASERRNALVSLCENVERGDITLPEPGTGVNLHCHSFFSYNYYGYSPVAYAWLARRAGLAVAGIVDFDVLDGLEEFLEAGRMLGLKTTVGIETRVFVPEFADKEINSPGEPGIAYHMGIGIPGPVKDAHARDFLGELVVTSARRNRGLAARVSEFLRPVEVDYDRDVISLTPSGNATERHLCLAFVRKAADMFGAGRGLVEFWSDKLGTDVSAFDLPDGPELQGTVRARTMKRGGAGYVRPDGGSFPTMADMNRFVMEAGGIPTFTWLDGTSDGEREIEKLLDVAMSTGTAALNIIPDRNYTAGAGEDDEKLFHLRHVVRVAEGRGLPVVVGTEMNSPGQKFVDDFESAELSPLLPVFLKGAHITYAHSVLQGASGLGYTSGWASRNFDSTESRNEFFKKVGETLRPDGEGSLEGLGEDVSPQEILRIACARDEEGP